jgi:dihydroorotase-like cyclic amidohydrolase
VNERGMDPSQFVRQLATNPAQIFGLYPRKGTIGIGSDADLVIFDPTRTWTARGADMLHKQKWTPFEGKSITGRVLKTIRRGEVIYDDAKSGMDRVSNLPGTGRYLARGYGQA